MSIDCKSSKDIYHYQGSFNPIPTFKLLVIGHSAVGKTSLVIRACSGLVPKLPHSTIVAENFQYSLTIDGQRLRFDIWDTAGQERFSPLVPMYYRGASGAIVVFDISQRSSFESAQRWIKKLTSLPNSINVICLVGNKVDLLEETDRGISKEEVDEYVRELNLIYSETSAITGEGLEQTLLDLGKELVKKVTAIEPLGAPRAISIARWPPRSCPRHLQTIPETAPITKRKYKTFRVSNYCSNDNCC